MGATPTSGGQPGDVGRYIIPVEVPVQNLSSAIGEDVIQAGPGGRFKSDSMYDYIRIIGIVAQIPIAHLASTGRQ
jgi:hypothetical protein